MPEVRLASTMAILRRELTEYRTSLCWTPLVMLLAVTGVMLIAVSMADHIDAVRKTVLELVPEPGETGSRVSIRIDDQQGAGPGIEYRVEKPFHPEAEDSVGTQHSGSVAQHTDELNPALKMLHSIFLFVLILVCANYLLAALYADRRDRSILFWKSMPVSETHDVLARCAVALLVAPALYLLASLLAQAISLGMGMLLFWRMELDPVALVWHRVDLPGLLFDHLAAYLLMTLWLLPTYAWLLLASSAATRSPFMLALTPILGLLLCERIVLGSSQLAAAFSRHIPHLGGGPYVGFHWQGSSDLPALLLGLVFAAMAVAGAVYLRRYYFEL